MVDCQWTRRLCGWDDRRQLDSALSWIADRAGRIAARTSAYTCRDATLIDGAHSWPLFTNGWKSGDIAPAGHVWIRSFHLDYSVPVWTYEVGGRQVEARIWMEPGAHTVYAVWLLQPGADPPEDGLSLRVTLLANDRDHHGTTSVGGFDPDIRVAGESLLVANAGLFSLTIRASGGEVVPKREVPEF